MQQQIVLPKDFVDAHPRFTKTLILIALVATVLIPLITLAGIIVPSVLSNTK